MYFVDRQKIEINLQCMEKYSKLYQEESNWENPIQLLALERIAHVMTDCVLDVGNAIIDGFIMRDPGSYDDIIDILLDEKVITEELEKQFKAILPIRKMIVQDYLEMDHEKVKETWNVNFSAYLAFPHAVREYLKNELGPVTAFKPEH
ncbi:DUF86 domain-containing protein [Bacillus testis]|uniref:DUF86 domain-containing protein n=1 Tax=Bacillus testis TaxID=1622072 RepID=UPI00067F23AF|nr:DUF86 domain-containing protein [Bacillus testis]